jgi:hypothetical protein
MLFSFRNCKKKNENLVWLWDAVSEARLRARLVARTVIFREYELKRFSLFSVSGYLDSCHPHMACKTQPNQTHNPIFFS